MNKKSRVWQAVLKVVTYALCGIMIAVVIFLMISNAQKKVNFLFGYTTLWVMTPSMEPQIPAQSYILVKKATANDVSLNDVISFYSKDPALNGSLNTHRIVEIAGDKEEFVTKGDNNAVADSYRVKADDVVAVYVKNLPLLTLLGRFTATKAGVIIMLLAMVALIVIVYLPDIIAYVKKRDEADKKAKEEETQRLIDEEVERLRREGENNGRKDE